MNLVYEVAKNLKGVGNQNAIETHVITISLDHKDYGAVGARSSTRATLPTWFQDTYLLLHSQPKQAKFLENDVAAVTMHLGKFLRSIMAP